MSTTNIQVLKPSREKPASGPGSYLIHIHDQISRDKIPEFDQLTPDRLLLPPIFIDRIPWTKGYFETVGTQPPV